MARPTLPCPFYGMPCEYVPMANAAHALAEENQRLRAALQTIADMTDYGTETATWRMTGAIHNANVIARAALAQGGDK